MIFFLLLGTLGIYLIVVNIKKRPRSVVDKIAGDLIIGIMGGAIVAIATLATQGPSYSIIFALCLVILLIGFAFALYPDGKE
ncbi:hypothetical protein C5S30_05235 [ANME-1 cluster archaeon GoMg4]|nr:hypothetical protein [ANME-1 cluster archaeon GoMg4]